MGRMMCCLEAGLAMGIGRSGRCHTQCLGCRRRRAPGLRGLALGARTTHMPAQPPQPPPQPQPQPQPPQPTLRSPQATRSQKMSTRETSYRGGLALPSTATACLHYRQEVVKERTAWTAAWRVLGKEVRCLTPPPWPQGRN
eukprot:Rmarinus@m.3048